MLGYFADTQVPLAPVPTLITSSSGSVANNTTHVAGRLTVASTSNVLIAVLGISLWVGTVTITVNDNQGGTWVVDKVGTVSVTAGVCIARCQTPGATGSTDVSFNFSGMTVAATNARVQFMEWAHLNATPLDSVPAGVTGASTTPSTPSIAQSNGRELLIGGVAISSGGTLSAPTGGFTLLGTSDGCGCLYMVASDSASHTGTCTATTGTWVGLGVSYKHA